MGNLENVSVERLLEAWNEVDDPEAVRRLAPAIAYKEIDDMTQTKAATMYGFSSAWATTWFDRLERLSDEPIAAVVSDKPRSGRPPKLTSAQGRQVMMALGEPPTSAGIDADIWTVRTARQYIVEEFGVEYSERHVRRLLSEWHTGPETSDSDAAASQE